MNEYNGKNVKQLLSLYISTGLTIIVGIGVSVFNTQVLGPQEFGDYKFLQSVFNFFVVFFTLGFFHTGSYVLAKKDNENIVPELIGSILLLAFLISLFFSLFIYSFSFFQGMLFENNLDRYMRIFSPLLFVFPFQLCLMNIFQGTNRIFELSFFRLVPPILYLTVAFTVNLFFSFSLFTALFTQLCTLALVICAISFFLKPNFSDIKHHILTIYKINKSFGFQVYIGSLASLASAQFGILTIAFFVDNIGVGYFSLAMTITAPLLMIPNIIGTTFFKTFSSIKAIPNSIIVVTLALTFVGLSFFLLIAKWVVISLYTEDYLPTVFLSYILAVGFAIHGIGDFTNRFLYAHGQGNYLRNSSLVVGIVNIAGYVLFVRLFGIKGAAITLLSGSSIYCAMMIFYYRKYIH